MTIRFTTHGNTHFTLQPVRWLGGFAVACGLSGVACEEQEQSKRGQALADIAEKKGTLADAAKQQAEAQPAPPPQPVLRRPMSEEELLLTQERRQRLEERHSDAAGFLSSEDLEAKLQKMNLTRGKKEPAIAAFDRLASGKWVLFTGPVAEPKKDSLQMPMRYTARDPKDPFGLTATWFPVTITDIEGYDVGKYEVGDHAAILAQYQGDGEASPAFDVVLLDEWFEKPKKKSAAQ